MMQDETMTPETLPRVTYSNIAEDFSGVHAHLDRVIPAVKAEMLGRERANWIAGRDDRGGAAFTAVSPIDRDIALGTFWAASPGAVDRAVRAALAACGGWRHLGWETRAALCHRVADVMTTRRFEMAVACLIEVGKSRMEALGEVEEAIDLVRFYADELIANQGFDRDLQRANPREETRDVLRPFGVFGVIAPFNFPVALSIGMSIAALLAGNTVVFKPSPMAGLTGRLLADCIAEAGLPEGVFNLVCGGAETGSAIVAHPGIDGISFTGSQADSEELVQETLVAAYHAFPTYRAEGSVRAFLYGIARRLCGRYTETQARQKSRLHLVHDASASRGDASEVALEKERAGRARDALAKLKPSEREAVVLRYDAGLGFRELALACGIDEATARKRVSRALARLRAEIGEE